MQIEKQVHESEQGSRKITKQNYVTNLKRSNHRLVPRFYVRFYGYGKHRHRVSNRSRL